MENQQINKTHSLGMKSVIGLLLIIGLLTGCSTQISGITLSPVINIPSNPTDIEKNDPDKANEPNQNIDMLKTPHNTNTEKTNTSQKTQSIQDGIKKDEIVIYMSIQGNHPGIRFFNDAIRAKIVSNEDHPFKIIESNTIETDFELTGQVSVSTSTTHSGLSAVEMIISDLKLINLYAKSCDTASLTHTKDNYTYLLEKSVILSASTIRKYREARTENLALQAVTSDAIKQLDIEKFFVKLASNKIVSQWDPHVFLISVKNTPSAIEAMEHRLIEQLNRFVLEITNIQKYMPQSDDIKSAVANEIKKYIKDLPKKETIQDLKNHIKDLTKTQTIREIVYQLPQKIVDALPYLICTGIIIEITTGQFYPAGNSKLVDKKGISIDLAEFNTPQVHFIKQKSLSLVELQQQYGLIPFILEASAKGNNVALKDQEITKLISINRIKPDLLNQAGIVVIYP